MKTSTYINDLLQASFAPALFIWTPMIILIGVTEKYIISISLHGNENIYFGGSAIIAYILSCILMHKSFGEEYRNPYRKKKE